MFLGDIPDVEQINCPSSARRYRNVNLPQNLPAKETAAYEQSQKMRSLRNGLESRLPGDQKEYQKTIKERKILRRQALKNYQNQWLRDEYQRTVSTGGLDCAKQISAQKNFDFLQRFMPERARLAGMIGILIPSFDERRKHALQDLIAICSQSD